MIGTNLAERAARIEQVFMSPEQQRVFQMFVGLGHDRTLPRLLEACKAADITLSYATLKRWSSKFHWVDLADRTEQQISQRVADEAMPLLIQNTQRDLDIIQKLKETFYERVEAGEIKIELSDYVMLLKTQALLVGDPTERKEIINTDKHEVTVQMTDSQLAEMMRLDAAIKHGLPPPTYENEEND